MPPDGGTAIHESQLLRTFGAPTAAAFVLFLQTLHRFYIEFIKLTFTASIKSFQQFCLLDLIKII